MSLSIRLASAICIAILNLSLGPVWAEVSASGRLEPVDGDHDGIPDHRDQCPDTAQLRNLPKHFKYRLAVAPERYAGAPKAWPVDQSGCEPDSDRDGVIDSQDYCPGDSKVAVSKGVAANGCPAHSDFDGTPDFRDLCPGTPRGMPTDASGCPSRQRNETRVVPLEAPPRG